MQDGYVDLTEFQPESLSKFVSDPLHFFAHRLASVATNHDAEPLDFEPEVVQHHIGLVGVWRSSPVRHSVLGGELNLERLAMMRLLEE